MERIVVELASGNEERMRKMQEIVSWFSSLNELRAAAAKFFRNLTVEEDKRLSPYGMPVGSLAALLWAMEETETGNPSQTKK